MRILVCGDRNFTDWERISSFMYTLSSKDIIIEGEARGADSIARDKALARGLSVLPFPADWAKYSRAAGPIRNKQMLDEGKPDMVVAFHDNIEQSKGTKNMLNQALGRGIQCYICEWIEPYEIWLRPYKGGDNG